jgi:hypothetical protein
MPLNMFLILGIIQYGLICQARILAKYAAYRAVRVGVMNNADPSKMRDAALLAMLPVLPRPTNDVLSPSATASAVITKYTEALIRNSIAVLRPVDVVICGPLKADLSGASQSDLTGVGSGDQVDFDDPRVSTENGGDVSQPSGFTQYMRTKLRVQVQVMYRLIIPFANFMISRAYLGLALPDVTRMQGDPATPDFRPGNASLAAQLITASESGTYIAPINVSYAMRMQSDFYTKLFPLPDKNLCVHYPGK